MQLNLVPVDTPRERKLQSMFQTDSFQLFIETLEAKYEKALYEAKIDSAQRMIDPELDADAKEKLFIACQLGVALKVIKEHTSAEEHHTLQIDV